MKRARYQKKKQNHYCILINPRASQYNFKHVRKLITAVRENGDFYSVFEPSSPSEMTKLSEKICRLRRWGKSIPDNFTKRGKVTALIACGGDGTINLTARAAAKAGIPFGVIPMGKSNYIVKSILGSENIEHAVGKILNQSYRMVDYAEAGDFALFSSLGFKFTYRLARYFETNSPPRLGMGWNKLGMNTAELVERSGMVIKIDSFRFELTPAMLQINLLPITNGLHFSEMSISDDQLAELILDYNADKKQFGNYLKSLFKRKYLYGSEFRIFRGKTITIEGIKGLPMYLDGEIVKPSGNAIDIVVQEKQLKVFC